MVHKNNQTPEQITAPAGHRLLIGKHIVVYLCIWFLVIALVMFYFTITGSPQAGLLEIGISAFIFIISFYFVIRFFPYIAKIFSLAIVTVFGLVLIYMNYHFLKLVKNDASFKQLLVGDLFVRKIMRTFEGQSIILANRGGISGTTPNHEKPLQTISLDQLKKSVADLSVAGLQSPHIAPPESLIKAKPSSPGEKYEITPLMKSIRSGVLGLEWKKEDGSMIRESLDRDGFIPLPQGKFIQETPVAILEAGKTQPPLIEKATGITPAANLNKPLKETKISID